MKRIIYQIKPVLGDLEMKVLEKVSDYSSPREVLERLKDEKNYAYTTIMTVLDKLYKKGYLRREKKGKTYYYSLIENYQVLKNNSLRQIVNDGFVYFGVFNFINAETDLTFSYLLDRFMSFFQRPVLKTAMVFSSVLLMVNFVFHIYLEGFFDYFIFLFINPTLLLRFNLVSESISIIEFLFVTIFLFITFKVVFFRKKLPNRYQFKFF